MIEHFQSLFEPSPDAIWLVQDQQVVYANATVHRLAKRIEAKPGGKALNQLLKPCLGQRPGSVDHYRFTTNGGIVTLEASVTQIDYADQTYRLFVGRDVTVFVESAEALTRSLKEKEVLLQEVHHRVKNNLSVIIGLLQLQSSYVQDEEARQAFVASQSRIRSMALIHEQLYHGKNFSRIDFAGFITGYSSGAAQYMPAGTGRGAHLELDLDPVEIDITKAVPLALVMNELLINAYSHAFKDGRPGHIFVSLRPKDDHVQLFLKDNGIGLPADFVLEKQYSLGFVLIRELVKQIAGQIKIESSPIGTQVTIKIPYGPNNK